jgi:muramoyltetrapeptide carboxypeptidase
MTSRPKQLNPGDRIGVVAPSGVYDAKRLRDSIRLLEEWGFTCVMGPNLGKTHRYLAGTDSERLQDLQWALSSPDLDAVWAARGGYGLNRILPGLDFSDLDDRPVIGFSDVTSLHVALFQMAGKSGVHGPVLHSLVSHPSQASQEHLRRLLGGMHEFSMDGVLWREGSASGPVVGGNLCMLTSLCGSPWQLKAEGCILLVEDVGEAPYRVDRMLQQLRMAGCLDGVVGVAVGSFEGCLAPVGADWGLRDLICEALDVPMIGALPVGHGSENRAFVYGASGRIDGHSLVFGPAVQ